MSQFRRFPSHLRGFTLLETALVLVLAGVLVSGILKGQELVGQARAKAIMNDLTGVNSAALAYFDRYKAWPGDDPGAGGATGRWSVFNAKSGTGDGAIGGKYNDPAPAGDPGSSLTIAADGTGESVNFWWHLRVAGFAAGPISGPGAANLPTMPSGGILGVQTGEPALPGFFTGLTACVSNVPERIAVTIDVQLDDQRPNGGFVRGLKQPGNSDSPALSAADATLNAYTEDGSSRYVVCRALQWS